MYADRGCLCVYHTMRSVRYCSTVSLKLISPTGNDVNLIRSIYIVCDEFLFVSLLARINWYECHFQTTLSYAIRAIRGSRKIEARSKGRK
jgi:hypothetical protein